MGKRKIFKLLLEGFKIVSYYDTFALPNYFGFDGTNVEEESEKRGESNSRKLKDRRKRQKKARKKQRKR